MTPRPPSRRGSVYILVLVSMAIAGAVVLSSLQIASGRTTEAGLVTESFQASQYAHSAIEAGLEEIAADPTWRWTDGDGPWRTNVTTDRGTLSLSVTGGDGSALSQDAWQPAKLSGTGSVGMSRSIYEVQIGLQGEGVPVVGEVIFSNTGLAVWPFVGGAAAVVAEQVLGNAPVLVDGTEPFRPGAVPGLGTSSAPWFDGGAHAKVIPGTGYEGIRSVSFWFWADSVTSTQGMVVRNATGYAAGSWSVYLQSGMLYAHVESSGGSSVVGAAVSARQWHHVVMNLNRYKGVLFLDGVEVGRTAARPEFFWDASANTEDIYVGVSHSGSLPGSADVGSPFTGSICHLVLMGEQLTETEVTALYDGYPSPAQYKVLVDTWNRVSE
jgi:hypothetical protein